MIKEARMSWGSSGALGAAPASSPAAYTGPVGAAITGARGK
jgi:hypothetical protein